MTEHLTAITDDQIEQLKAEAGAAGDSAQVALCEAALGYETIVRYEGRYYRRLAGQRDGIAGPHYRLGGYGDTPNEDLTAASCFTVITQAEARAECERVISEARGEP